MNIAQELVDLALSGNGHKQVPEIPGLPEYFAARKILRSVNRIARAFRLAQKIAFKNYCANIKYDIYDNDFQISYAKFKECENYYNVESCLISDAIHNYEEFFKNNWIRVLFLGVRLDDE